MADHAVDDDDGDIFIYRGGWAPLHVNVTHVCIDKSVDEIEENAFRNCQNLVQVDTHNGIRKVGRHAFRNCTSLRRINLKSAVEIDEYAFYRCGSLESVEFGDNLEKIGRSAFLRCYSLQSINLPSVVTIGMTAFSTCKRLTDIKFSERLVTIEKRAFYFCYGLQRIAIPLKRNLFEYDDESQQRYNQFDCCQQLTTVEPVGEIHKTVASLHMESWRNDMDKGINQINQVLPNTPSRDKTDVIRQWMESVIDKMDHYKAEHNRYVKEGITLLELALWKAKLGEKEDSSVERQAKKAKTDSESTRKERRITCGADIVIKNVLPFLQLKLIK